MTCCIVITNDGLAHRLVFSLAKLEELQSSSPFCNSSWQCSFLRDVFFRKYLACGLIQPARHHHVLHQGGRMAIRTSAPCAVQLPRGVHASTWKTYLPAAIERIAREVFAGTTSL